MNLKDGLFLVLGALWSGSRGASILMYHSIEDKPDHFNSVPPGAFERQMQYLAAHAYEVITLTELVRRMREGKDLTKCIVLTFDDGFRNNYTRAFPILKKFKFPATIFVTTEWIGTRDEKSGLEYLRPDELKEMQASGVIDIEPHTATHPKLATLSLEEARKEMLDSKKMLENMFGTSKKLFAYPYGNYAEETLHAARECGFEAAVTVREGTVVKGAKLLELPRNSIDRSTSFMQFKGKVSSVIDRYEALKAIL